MARVDVAETKRKFQTSVTMSSPSKDLVHNANCRIWARCLPTSLLTTPHSKEARSLTRPVHKHNFVTFPLPFDTFRCLNPFQGPTLMLKRRLFANLMNSTPFSYSQLVRVRQLGCCIDASDVVIYRRWRQHLKGRACLQKTNFSLSGSRTHQRRASRHRRQQWRRATTRRQAGLTPNRHAPRRKAHGRLRCGLNELNQCFYPADFLEKLQKTMRASVQRIRCIQLYCHNAFVTLKSQTHGLHLGAQWGIEELRYMEVSYTQVQLYQ